MGRIRAFGSTATTPETPFFWHNELHTFVSIEPILGPFKDLTNDGIDPVSKVNWIIIGAETGNRKNKVQPGKIKRTAQRLAREMMESGDDLEDTHTGSMLQRRNAEFSAAVEAEAMRIIEKAREKRRRENNETGQLSIFDMMQNDTNLNT